MDADAIATIAQFRAFIGASAATWKAIETATGAIDAAPRCMHTCMHASKLHPSRMQKLKRDRVRTGMGGGRTVKQGRGPQKPNRGVVIGPAPN